MIKWIERLLALFIFLIPWQARVVLRAGELQGGFWEYGTISVYATDILFILILLFIGTWVIQQRLKLPISNYQFPIKSQISNFKITRYALLVTGYVALSIFWSFDRLVAFYAALKLFEGIVLFLLVLFLIRSDQKRNSQTFAQLLIWAFVASAVVQSVLAIAQFFTQSVFTWPFSGIAPQDPSDLGVAVVQFGEERWLRAYGSFPHPNLLGAFLAIALLLFFHLTLALSSKEREVKNYSLLLGEGPKAGRAGVGPGGVRSRWLLLVAHCLLLTGLFLTFSRAAWLAFFIGLVMYAAQSKAWKEKIFLQLVLILVITATVLTVLFFPLVRTRIGGGERLEIQSNQERTVGYREAVQLIRRHPFFGVGIGNYTAAVARELRPNAPAWSYQPVHNVFLLILSELGLIGILIFITPFIPLILRGRRGGYSLLVTLAILSLFDHSFWTLHSGILLAWFSLSLDTS